MTLLVDAGALFALADVGQSGHLAVRRVLEVERGVLLTSEVVLAEADYLILDRLGVRAELVFVRDLAAGGLRVECLGQVGMDEALDVLTRYRDLRIGLADASLVVLARRFRTNRVLTFDERAFRAVTPLQGGSFRLLPADA